MRKPTLKEATEAVSKMPKKAREKLFSGLRKNSTMAAGAWATQNKHCLKDWMEYCGVDNPAQIDYTEPHVYIENILNNPEYRSICLYGSIEDKELFLYSQLTTKEYMDMYFIGDGTGAYCELEKDKGKEGKEWYQKQQMSN